MKKVLLASTALILTAGVAAADGHAGVSLSGEAKAGFTYVEGAAEEINDTYKVDMKIAGKGSTDSGLEFGAFVKVDTNAVDDAEAYIKGTFGTITMGGVDPAVNMFGLADPGLNGLGVDDIAEQYRAAGGGANVHYKYEASGLTFAASLDVGESDTSAVAVKYAAGAFSAGIGYANNATNSTNTVTAQVGFSQGAFSANAMYSDWSGGGQGYGVDASFSTGATKITAAYATQDGAPVTAAGDGYALGVSVPLGGGLSVEGAVGSVNSVTRADLGVKMKF